MSYCEPEIPSCFTDIIAIKGNCTQGVPYSGIFLDSVGIKLSELDAIVDGDYEDGEELFNEKLTYAIQSVTSSIHTHLTENYKADSLLKSERVGFVQDNLIEVSAQAGKLKGIYVELCNEYSFVDFYLNFLEVQFNFTGDVDIFIYDTIQNRLLDTVTVSSVAQEITQVYVNKTYKSNRKRLSLFIGYDSTAVPSYKTFTRNNYHGCLSCDGYWWKNSYLKTCGAHIATADDKILKNFTRTGETYGLSINYSVNCNHEDWLCSYGRALAIPIALYTAREIALYAINVSQQANPKTFIDSEKWKARFDQYDADFNTRIDEVLKNIKLPSDSKCFHCSTKLVHAISIP